MQICPVGLRCEYLTQPLGIDTLQPRLGWRLESAARGQVQTAFQVLVAGSRDLLDADTGDCWDSGKVEGSQSAHVVYAGAALRSGMRYWWKVRVWDAHGGQSDYSAAAWWEMGLLDAADWVASWVGLDQARTEEALPALYIRKPLTLSQAIRRARLFISAKGVYEAYINGRRVGDAVLAPGWTDYDKRIQYQTYDVTGMLRPGANVLGAILGEGWYSGSVGEWLYRYVAGIDIDAQRPGYQQIILRPRPGGGLTHARATYDSIRGPISSAWRIDDDMFALDVAIPANTTATVYIPAAAPDAVTEGGRPAGEAAGVRFLRYADGAVVFEVGSGTYAFASVGYCGYDFVQSPMTN